MANNLGKEGSTPCYPSDLRQAELRLAHEDNIQLSKSPYNSAQILFGRCYNADFANARLFSVNFSHADLWEANLTHIRFVKEN